MSLSATDQLSRQRYRLSDLVMAVVAVAVVLSGVRETRSLFVDRPTTLFWELAAPPTTSGPAVKRIDPYRMFALVEVIFGAFGSVGMLVGAFRGRRSRAARLAWLFSAGLLALCVMGLADALALFPSDTSRLGPLMVDASQTRVVVGSVSLFVGLVGMLLALKPVRVRPDKQPSRGWPVLTTFLCFFSAATALALVNGLICYLVVIAIEAVRNALRHPPSVTLLIAQGRAADWPSPSLISLRDRINDGFASGLIVLLACALTSSWLARDRFSTEPRGTWPGLVYRAATALVAGLGGIWLFSRTLAWVQPMIREGLMRVVWPDLFLMLVSGFGMMALGLSLRRSCPAASRGAVGSLVSTSREFRLLMCLLIGATALMVLLGAVGRIIPERLRSLEFNAGFDHFLTLFDPARYYLPDLPGSLGAYGSLIAFEPIVLCLALIGMGVGIFQVFVRRGIDAPLDAALGDGSRKSLVFLNFLSTVALVVGLFPALILTSLGLTQLLAMSNP